MVILHIPYIISQLQARLFRLLLYVPRSLIPYLDHEVRLIIIIAADEYVYERGTRKYSEIHVFDVFTVHIIALCATLINMTTSTR